MDPISPAYCQQRERMERAAAKRAASPEARRVHQELAQRYAALARQNPESPDAPERAPRRRLTIVAPGPECS